MMTEANSLDGRKLSLSTQKALRQRVIEAYKKGIKRTQIAKTFGMSRQWVWKVLRAFEKHGEEAAIAGHSRGPKPETSDKMRRLSRQEEAKLMAWIIDSNPSQLKFPWAVWTRKAVRDLIRREFGKEIAIRTISAYMKRWNMTPQRPKKKALQQDPVAVSKWLEETYPQIEQRAKAENALILWQDETAVKQDSNWVRSNAPKGQTPVLVENARTNYGAPVMISAINNQGKCFFLLQRKAVNAYHFIRFLHRLILDLGGNGRKLFVICDNARIYHARIVQRWIEAHEKEIELFYLPAYWPTLNPDEYLNRNLKTELRLQAAGTHDDNLERAHAFMERCQRETWRVQACFLPEDVQYAQEKLCA